MNADGYLDIIVANNGGSNIGILLNVGNGTFLNQTTYTTGTGSTPRGVAIGDVNGDNKPDMVAANNGGNNAGVFLHC